MCKVCGKGTPCLCQECAYEMVKKYKVENKFLKAQYEDIKNKISEANINSEQILKESKEIKSQFKHFKEELRKAEEKIKAYENQVNS